MYDRSRGLTDSPYKIIRTFTTGESIKAKVLPLILQKYDESRKDEKTKQFNSLLQSYKDSEGSRFSMFDYNPVKSLAATTQFFNAKSNEPYYILPNCENRAALSGTSSDTGNSDKANYFLKKNQANYELVEYFTNDEKVIFINGNVIYKGKKEF